MLSVPYAKGTPSEILQKYATYHYLLFNELSASSAYKILQEDLEVQEKSLPLRSHGL